MSIQQSLVGCAAALVVSMSAAYAGPCSDEIDRLRAELDPNVAAGSFAYESTAAKMHRQPTQESMAAAEAKSGEISPDKVGAVTAAMASARAADGVGDRSACEQALADVQRARGR